MSYAHRRLRAVIAVASVTRLSTAAAATVAVARDTTGVAEI
ncbi:hypothetical protein [Paraburkholderia sp. BR14320]